MTSKLKVLILFAVVVLVAAALAACAAPSPTPTEATEAPPEETEAPATEEVPTEEVPAGTPIEDFEQVPIVTTASDVVGVGTYVAAEPYAVPAGEDPAAQPVQAFIMPYGIYPNMHVENIEEFDPTAQPYHVTAEGFTYEWSLQAPPGSNSTLNVGPVVTFLADVPGDYVLTLTATDEAGNSGTTSWTVHAATYVGMGGEGANPPQCVACHASKAEAWAQTGHASIFTSGIEGTLSDHYGPNCISCHTTGFNNRPEAVNGGFDDLMAQFGWVFPAELKEGNWQALLTDYPEVAALANVQCEACHGPGSDHYTGDVQNMGPIARGLSYGTCAQCHAEEPYHVFPQQWELSGHADGTAFAFWYPIGEERLACVQCHSGAGYIDAVKGVPMEERRSGYQVITCAVCHDPHDAKNPNQLRVFDTVTLPNGTEVTGAGAAATCMTCHNARTNPVAAVEGERFSTPHYSAAAELLTGGGGYTWGMELPNSMHVTVIEEKCITCHMAPTPGVDDKGTEDKADDEPLPGHNTVGEHTFAMTSPVDGTQNVAVCQSCHGAEMTSFTLQAKGDYDGDGAVETNEDEIAGLLELLRGELEAKGVSILPYYPYFQLPENADVNLKGAVYNFKLVRDNADPAHNLDYIVALLQLSYEKLTGSPVPNAEILY